MAISQKNYVEVNSRFPEKASVERNLGGLVFTSSDPISSAYTDPTKTTNLTDEQKAMNALVKEYNDGNLVALDLGKVISMFGGPKEATGSDPAYPGSKEYLFAVRYYSYSSPTGQVPSTLKFAKRLASNYGPYRVGKAYKEDSYLFHEEDGNKQYKVTADITAAENKQFSDISSKLSEDTALMELESPAESLDRVDKSDNSFGSFVFLDPVLFANDMSALKAVASKNTGLGTRYLFSLAYPKGNNTSGDIVAAKNKVVDTGTVGLSFIQGDSIYSAAMPMSIFAATDYDSGDEAPCHMFKVFPSETPTVFNDNDYETLSRDFINFYGQTQSNGKKISFYQRGFNTDGTDTAIYCNEVWFKSRCITRLMNMFMSSERIPANDEGMAMVRFRVAEVCDIATSNGSFMPKTPREADQNAIRNLVVSNGGTTEEVAEIISGIENIGYGIFTYLGQKDGEYFIHYYVFYGSADSIRFVKGDDVLVK